jgi:hypothetical protein
MARREQVLGRYDRARQIANSVSQEAAAAQLSALTQAYSAFNQHPTVTNCSLLGSNLSRISR